MAKPIVITVAILFMWLYVREFERNNIYYPSAAMERNPRGVNLDYEDIFFESKDGFKLNGWFVPAGNSKGTILFCHGNAGNISNEINFLAIFNKLNLNTFIFDYRGYGKSQGKPNEKGFYQDVWSAYNYLVIDRNIKPEKIILFGRSLGAAVAVELATKVKIAGLILEGGFTSTVDVGKELYPYLPVRIMVTQEFDSISKIGKIEVPKLIIHSKDDEVIPFHHGQRLFKEAISPKEFYEIKGSHNEGYLLEGERYLERISGFVKEVIYN